jgi:hypothetical protein
MNEATLKSLLHRAMISSGQQRVADLTEALALARELAGTSHLRKAPPSPYVARNDLSAADVARGDLNTVENLRGMLDWPEVKASPRAVARLARALRLLR